MEKEEITNLKANLEIIYNVIQKTKENIKENVFYFLLWGWLITIAAILNYFILDYSTFKYHYLPWAVLMPA